MIIVYTYTLLRAYIDDPLIFLFSIEIGRCGGKWWWRWFSQLRLEVDNTVVLFKASVRVCIRPCIAFIRVLHSSVYCMYRTVTWINISGTYRGTPGKPFYYFIILYNYCKLFIKSSTSLVHLMDHGAIISAFYCIDDCCECVYISSFTELNFLQNSPLLWLRSFWESNIEEITELV